MHHILKSIQGVNNQLILGSWLLIFILVCLCFSTPVSAYDIPVYGFNRAPDGDSCMGVVLFGPPSAPTSITSSTANTEGDTLWDCYDDIKKYISLDDEDGDFQAIAQESYIFLERTPGKLGFKAFGEFGCGHVIAVNQDVFNNNNNSAREAELIYWSASCKDGPNHTQTNHDGDPPSDYQWVIQNEIGLRVKTIRIGAEEGNQPPPSHLLNKYSLNELPEGNSCRNVILWGKGGDELKSGSRQWFCYDDFFKANQALYLPGISDEYDHFEGYDSSKSDELQDARNNYYVFIEQRTNKCGNRILIHKDEFTNFENDSTYPIRGIVQDNNAHNTAPCKRYSYKNDGLAIIDIDPIEQGLDRVDYVMESDVIEQIKDEGKCDGTAMSGIWGDNLERRDGTENKWECNAESDRRKTESYKSPNHDHRHREMDIDNFYVFTEYLTELTEENVRKCGSRILIEKNSFSSAVDKGFGFGIWQDWKDKCDEGPANGNKKSTLVVIVLESPTGDTAVSGQNVVQGNSSSSNPAPQNCEVLAGWLSWVICPLLEAATGILNWAETQAIDSLRIDSSKYNQPANQPAVDEDQHYLYELWSTMRDFVTYAIIGTALFMIISTAFDIGVFKNYTVKKYLPKLVAGTIFIQFSWILGDLMIQGFTQLGDLVASIIYGIAPTELRGWGLDKILGGGGIGTDGLSIIAVGGAAWGWVLLLPVMFTLAIGLFIAYLFLVFRKILIIALLVFGPIGLALWILPGNDRAWRFYFKTFFYLLLLYPVIVTIIAFGKFFSWLIIQTDW